MKKLILVLIFACVLLSCNSKNKEKASQISSQETDNESTEDDLEKVFVYEGLLPCADCEGIETVLKIYQGDGTMESHKFELSSIYQGKGNGEIFKETGNFNLERGFGNDPDGTIYVLNYDKPEKDQIFYGYTATNPDKIFLLNNKREKIKSKLNYFLMLNE